MKSIEDVRDREELLSRLRVLQPDSRRRWGRMSAHQMVCHLADSFRVSLGERSVSSAINPFNRTVLKWLALYLPLPWPPGIGTRPELDQVRGCGSKPIDFERDVAELAALVDRVAAPTMTFERERHPLFGRMSRAAWLRWGYLHMDHHLRQFGV